MNITLQKLGKLKKTQRSLIQVNKKVSNKKFGKNFKNIWTLKV